MRPNLHTSTDKWGVVFVLILLNYSWTIIFSRRISCRCRHVCMVRCAGASLQYVQDQFSVQFTWIVSLIWCFAKLNMTCHDCITHCQWFVKAVLNCELQNHSDGSLLYGLQQVSSRHTELLSRAGELWV